MTAGPSPLRKQLRRVRKQLRPAPMSEGGRPRSEPTGKPRVLYFIVSYPNFSETYMHEEIRSLQDRFDIEVISLKNSGAPRRDSFHHWIIPYEAEDLVYGRIEKIDPTFSTAHQKRFLERVEAVIDEFQPDILHAHYLGLSMLLEFLGERHGLPFTVRTHSMDVLNEPDEKLEAMCATTATERCKRVLTFPSNRARLLDHGADEDRLVDCWPVLRFDLFHHPEKKEPTGRVMCAGPAIKKKAHHEFVELAHTMRDSGLSFDLYGAGPTTAAVTELNESLGNPATMTYADPEDMPGVYPNYDWIVYPSDTELNKVGLPVAIAEAMAAGLGVVWQELPGRRQEQLDFLGGAGYLVSSMDEVPAIITQPYPDEKRLAGYEAARRCDIADTKHLLSDAWDEALATL